MTSIEVTAPLARAQKMADTAGLIAIIAAIALGGSALVDIGAAAFRELKALGPGREALGAVTGSLAGQWLLALPSLIIALVLLDLRRVMADYAAGRFFTRRASAGVRKAGEGLLWAMAFACIVSPTLYGFIVNGARGGPLDLRLEAFDLGLIALGAFIMVMGRALEAAAAIKAENDAII